MKKRYHIFIGLGLFVGLFILGSFFDLQIAEAIYHPKNFFGLALERYGTIPGYGCLALVGGILSGHAIKGNYKTWVKVVLFVFGLICLGIGGYEQCDGVFHFKWFDTEDLTWVTIAICGFIIILFYLLGLYLSKYVTDDRIWIYVLIMTLVVVVAFLVGVFGSKSIFHRPRYRDLVAPGIVRFYNWWEVCKEYKTLDVDPEFFKSFPSGHTCGTACSIMVLAYLPLFFEKLKSHQTFLFYGALIYTLVVAFSRMTLGAHFLTDISMGGILFMVYFIIGNEFVLKFSKNDKD